jgi:hypothetical protein
MAADTRKREVCVHEAGHAVVAKALGGRNLTLSLYEDRGGHGACRFDLPYSPDWFEKQLAFSMAGPIAADIAQGIDLFAIRQDESQIARGYLQREGEPRPNCYRWALDHVRQQFPARPLGGGADARLASRRFLSPGRKARPSPLGRDSQCRVATRAVTRRSYAATSCAATKIVRSSSPIWATAE